MDDMQSTQAISKRKRPWSWKNVRLPRRREDEISRNFQIDVYRAHLESQPNDVETLMELGNLYTLTGRVEDGLEVDQRLVEIKPREPIFLYNYACSLALVKRVDEALEILERAVEAGYDNLEYLEEDSDLDALRDDPRYTRIVARLRLRDPAFEAEPEQNL